MRPWYITGICVVLAVGLMLYVNVCGVLRQNGRENNLSVMTCIKDRVCIDENSVIKIGNSKKELENGYYDVLLEENETGFVAHINKLWKTKFNERLYEEEYANEVAMFLISRMESSIECEEVVKYMIEGYVESKNDETNKLENKEVTKELEKEEINFKKGVYELIITVKKI